LTHLLNHLVGQQIFQAKKDQPVSVSGPVHLAHPLEKLYL